ncbi:MAG: hypothetical protein AAF773_03815 [Cyanobacteria bacterium P01_D01_bin.115]
MGLTIRVESGAIAKLWTATRSLPQLLAMRLIPRFKLDLKIST